MTDLLGLTQAELTEWCVARGQPAFRAQQLRRWLQAGVPVEAMKNLPEPFRARIREEALTNPVAIHNTLRSEKDDTHKFLFRLTDGNLIEGVWMRYKHGNTLCISTQVGCRMGCAFCASTLDGLVRNLTAGEMLGQVVLANALFQEGERRGVTNVVLMGAGEPLDNYENVLRFLRLVSDPEGLNISRRNLSLSTCGLIEGIDRLSGEALGVTLSVSLHAPTDEIRRQIMPIAKAVQLQELLDACRRYVARTGRRVIFEYALIRDLNDRKEHAHLLAARLRGLQCHVNLIPLNSVKERNLRGSEQARQFAAWLEAEGISATVRRELGADIQGACGQLRRAAMETARQEEKP